MAGALSSSPTNEQGTVAPEPMRRGALQDEPDVPSIVHAGNTVVCWSRMSALQNSPVVVTGLQKCALVSTSGEWIRWSNKIRCQKVYQH